MSRKNFSWNFVAFNIAMFCHLTTQIDSFSHKLSLDHFKARKKLVYAKNWGIQIFCVKKCHVKKNFDAKKCHT